MAIVNSSDLDRQMDQTVDLKKATVRSTAGAGEGVMQGVIQRGTDHRVQSAATTQRGAPVYLEGETGPTGFYGSKTVISVSALEQLDDELDPNSARKGVPPVIILGAAPSPAPAPAAAAATQAPAAKMTTQAELLARMGLRR